MSIRAKVLATIRRERMLPPRAAVTVALSGGADSVALLHLLLSLQSELSLGAVTAVHINHGLRGAEAVRDQEFVESLCNRLAVPLTVHTCHVAEIAREKRCGVEEAGREVRYAFFEKEVKNGAFVATAHTASDNVETLLLHLCRGSGLHGLTGIPPVRGNIVRPLLDCTREEIEAYCAEQNLAFVNDSTNTDVAYARNRIRQRVLPELKAINPQAEAAITRLICRAREWDTAITKQAETIVEEAKAEDGCYRRQVLQELQPELLSAVLRCILSEHGKQRGSEKHILEAAALVHGGGRLSVPGGLEFSVAGSYVRLEPAAENTVSFDFDNVKPNQSYVVGEAVWQVLCVSREEYEQKLNISKIHFANVCDYDKINGCLCLRSRTEGDSYRPAGRGCTKTLKKLFNEASLSMVQREKLPVLCDETGIVLVPSFGCDERVSMDDSTKTVLLLQRKGDV